MLRLACLLALSLLSAVSSGAQTFRLIDQPSYVDDSTANNRAALQEVADAAYAGRAPGQIATILIPPGVTSWKGVVNIVPDSVEIAGCGGTVVTRDVTSASSPTGAGETYYPVRRIDTVLPGACVSRLKVLSDAFAQMTGSFLPRTAFSFPPAVPFNGDQRFHRVWVRDLVFDGNAVETLQDLLAVPQHLRKQNLQDRPTVTALDFGRHGTKDYCADRPELRLQRDGSYRWVYGIEVGLLVSVERVEITGFAATGILGDYCGRFDLDTVRMSDSWYNHVLYKADGGGSRNSDGSLAEDQYNSGELGTWGGWTDVTLAGGSWTETVVMRGLNAVRLVYEDYRENPMRDNGGALMNVRLGGAAVTCLRVDERFPASYNAVSIGEGPPGLFGIQEPHRAFGYLWEDGRDGTADRPSGDCTPPASKVVLPRAPDRPPAPSSVGRLPFARRLVEQCYSTRTGRLVDLDVCDRQDARHSAGAGGTD